MPNGQVLIAGGTTNGYAPTRAAEVFDPSSGAFWLVGEMAMARTGHAAVATDLPGGKVLVLGGFNRTSGRDSLDLVEAYDPYHGTFAPGGQMQFDRVDFEATLLDDTSILLTGGTSSYNQWNSSAELSKYTHCGPLVTSMTPASGQPGTIVTIGGAQFGSDQGLSSVTFNGVPAIISSWSDTSISTSVPSGATTGPLVVSVNGRQSNGPTFSVTAPDLSIVGISANPASPAPNAPVTITVTARNGGDAPVAAFRVDFYKHSPSAPEGASDFTCDVSRLAAGATGTCVGTVTYTEGTHGMWAAVDVPDAIAESNEENNVFGPQSLVVSTPMPDLVESAMANPPATALLGSRIALSDTVRNDGNGPAGASATRYYLSLDTVKSSNDIVMVVRSVSALAPGATHTYNLQVTLSSTLALTDYWVLACADDANQVSERDETNNCRVSTTQMQIVSPDLIATAVSNPPANTWGGGSFAVADAVLNQGSGAAGASTTRYWLSADTVKGGADRMLNGTRAVPALAVNQSSGGSTVVTVANGTPLGTYYVLACADDVSQVIEANNNNNCIASATRVTVTGSDLVVSAGTNPPASVNVGQSFVVSNTVTNQGAVPTGTTSTTRYFLGLNPYRTGGDWLLTGSRVSPALGPGAADAFSVTVTLPTTMTAGSYYLLACADESRTVAETNESNNCWASSARVDVTRIVIPVPK
jgi:subtilase family serine protease